MRVANKLKVRPQQIVAFLLAPLVPGILFVIPSLFHNPTEGIWALKLSVMVTYPAMIVLGVPAHLLLVRQGWTRGWIYALIGLAIGMIISAIAFLPTEGFLFLGAIFGALIAFIFWAIARPDRSYSV
jgi:hypothetical protein